MICYYNKILHIGANYFFIIFLLYLKIFVTFYKLDPNKVLCIDTQQI